MEDQELTHLFLKSPAIKIYEKIHATLTDDEVMFTDPHPLAAEKSRHTPVVFIGIGLLLVLILLKPRPGL